MIAYLPYLIVAVILIVAAFWLEKRWRQTRPLPSADPATEPDAKSSWIDKVSTGFANLRDRLTGKWQETLATHFQKWVAEAKIDKSLKDWLTGLDKAQAEELTAQLAAFCNSLGLELYWLIENKVDVDASLKKQAEGIVISYCTACHTAANANADFKKFAVYQSLLTEPKTKANLELSKKVYAELVSRKIAAEASADLLLSNDKDRQSHVTKTIQESAEKNWKGFADALTEAMKETEVASEPAPASEPEAPAAAAPKATPSS